MPIQHSVKLSLCVSTLAVLLAVSAAAAADLRIVGWSTYLRAAPHDTAEVIDEVEHDTPVTVSACDARWCRVSSGASAGWIDRDALRLPRTTQPEPPARADCVVVGQADYRGPLATRFCTAAPAGR